MMKKKKVEDKKQGGKIILEAEMLSSSFYEAMKFPIKFAQCFSLFPIHIGKKVDLKFQWTHWRVVYSALTMICFVFELALHIHGHIRGNRWDNTTFTIIMVFHLEGIVQYILFFKLTMELPRFFKKWDKVESCMRNYEIFCNVKVTLKRITLSFMLFAFVEHTLVNSYKLQNSCRRHTHTSEALKDYFVTSYTHIFYPIEYSLWKGIFAQFLNLQRTFQWTYVDVFVMVISTAFKFRLKQMARRLKTLSSLKVMNNNFIKSTRKDYQKLCSLCDAINKQISLIVILCFASNMFFILLQLFNSMKKMDSTIEKLYFYTSFGMLLLRSIYLCIMGGEVHEQWKDIVTTLFSVQSSAYNMEVERFITHVTTYKLVLAGKNFFHVTRNLILKIAGATVTYELSLIHFNSAALE